MAKDKSTEQAAEPTEEAPTQTDMDAAVAAANEEAIKAKQAELDAEAAAERDVHGVTRTSSEEL